MELRIDPLTGVQVQVTESRQARPNRPAGRCAFCEYRHVCGGSRSRAYATSGDPYGDDPACAHIPAQPVSLSR